MSQHEDEHMEQPELYEHFSLEVDQGQGLLRIDKFLWHKLEHTSRSRIQAAAKAGNILVNNKPVKANYKVKPKDNISIVLPHPPRETEIIPQDIPIDVVYEDEDVVVINKEAGMVVHPGVGNYSGTLVNALAYRYQDNPLFSSGELRPGLVHRIDKNTSGLMVAAKNEMALQKLAKQFFDHSTERTYTALVWGIPEEEEGTIEGSIGRDPRDRVKMACSPDGSEGKRAITHYRIIEKLGYVSLVECTLETGRTHQIRVHFEHMGHPLFNDDLYGGDKILRGTTFSKYKQFVKNCFEILPRQALHANSLGFMHPSKGKKMQLRSELPEDMAGALEKWRNYLQFRYEQEQE